MPAQRQQWSGLQGLDDPLKSRAPASEAQDTARPGAPHRTTLRVLKRQRRRTPSIDRICRHLGCDLIKLRAAGDATCFFLGRGFSRLDDNVGERATPQFRSLEALEYFCDSQLERFLALECFPRRPRDWFWNNF
jgi:hypothetical protein